MNLDYPVTPHISEIDRGKKTIISGTIIKLIQAIDAIMKIRVFLVKILKFPNPGRKL